MISIYGGWIDVVLFNIVFWPAYAYICTLPEKMLQKVIDEA
jgi:hypothetical protein